MQSYVNGMDSALKAYISAGKYLQTFSGGKHKKLIGDRRLKG